MLIGLAVVGSQVAGAPLRHGPPGFELVLSEDFQVDAALGRFAAAYPGWAQYDGLRDTSRDLGRPAASQGRYSSATTTTVHDGVVDIFVHTAHGTPNVVALTPPGATTWDGGQLYGRYSVRFRADEVPGFKVAWLLWPTSDDWSDGEIDFPEGGLGDTINGYSHDVAGAPSTNAWAITTDTSMTDWHIATIEWTRDRLTFVLDKTCWTTTDSDAIPTVPMRWVLQTETELGRTPPHPAASGHVQVDWVRVWRHTGRSGPAAGSSTPPCGGEVVAAGSRESPSE